ncbi:MAG TPA: T9SS type A sorting domain-containing protein, partial [Candidatus Kapabacteria bacterium]|nr:T9SS type A sorting domain-containing protein [Candidatus Kapabacteria bacterium]
ASANFGALDTLPLMVDINASINIDSLWPYLNSISASYSWDSSVVSYAGYQPPAGWATTVLLSHGNSLDFSIQNGAATASNPLDLGIALFRSHTKELATSWVTLSTLKMQIGEESISACVTDNEDSHWSVKSLGVQSGVEEKATILQKGISIYPNPAENKVFVRNANASLAILSIYDEIGRTVASARVESASTGNIDIESLAPGSYIVVCYVNDQIVTQRLDKVR